MIQEIARFIGIVLKRRSVITLFLGLVVIPQILEIILSQFVLADGGVVKDATYLLHFINWAGSYYYFAFVTVVAYGALREMASTVRETDVPRHSLEGRTSSENDAEWTNHPEWSDSEIHRLTIKRNFWIVLFVEIVVAILMIAIATPVDGALHVLVNSVSVGTQWVWLAYTLSFAIRLIILTLVRVRLLLAATAVLVEDQGVWKAVARSWNITRGHWRELLLPILALTLPILLPWLLEYALGYAPPTFLTELFSDVHVLYSNWSALDWTIATLLQVITFAIVLLLPIVLVYLYRRFSETYDTFDVPSLDTADLNPTTYP